MTRYAKTLAYDPNNPPIIGGPSDNDIVAHYDDDIFAIAFYTEAAAVKIPDLLDWPWPLYPRDPGVIREFGLWLNEFAVALTPANMAEKVSLSYGQTSLKLP